MRLKGTLCDKHRRVKCSQVDEAKTLLIESNCNTRSDNDPRAMRKTKTPPTPLHPISTRIVKSGCSWVKGILGCSLDLVPVLCVRMNEIHEGIYGRIGGVKTEYGRY